MYTPHCHDLTIEMIYKIDGRLDVLAGDRWLDFPDRKLWIFLPGTMHSEKYSSPKSCYRMLWITVLPKSFTFHYTGYDPRRGYRVEKKGLSAARTPYGILATEMSMDGKLSDDPSKKIHFQTIVMHAMCYIHDNYENLLQSQRNDSQHIAMQVQDYIDNFYWHENLSLGKLADLVRYSPSHLNSMFRRHFKMPLHKYILDRRMAEAEKLLRGNDLLVGEVAARVGIADQLYFSRIFKKHFGISPSEYAGRNA